ncbi:MAG TPA: NAD-dependent protein deacylase [Muricauda sp.]|uniref:NAD-dependent protein deacylase n=1 Tax=Flagellimonas aurea TaxID=2915619 RepID=A0ABS3G4H1_9FLAO|nr:NAD-dependent deacylase [Allomuricauda aurea]MAO15676.1 NAD-dependent protein deacylase [Allomuricauda sp.]MBC70946.1 NAD-dependent protein deacylase [Allomuricauda sp.]MBO0354193.1 NAD-dependent deacylase [Allomuricauda aurea]HBU76787.1 NAD-dependent protein deacylase [Allomuricauda sp.]|tara:strand:- start:444 stop:1136 length:693 start_codon:yes stop_codon:yes gene_type:complete
MPKQKIVVLTGAGMSAESGLKTFRDENGLWEGHDVMQVASPQGFAKNPELVLEFYNQRRRQLLNVSPNKGHLALAELEQAFDVSIITQNVDNLHEQAGSSHVVHLHGELFKVRSTVDENHILDWKKNLILGDTDENGHQLRPHIVWFGEMVPMLKTAAEITQQADILIIVGTSMQVYPAASLIHYTPEDTPIYFIDPRPNIKQSDFKNLSIIPKTASEGTPELVEQLINN